MDNRESKKNYRTRQQEALENYFKLHPGACVTADEIYLYFMNTGGKIGKATIYRSLDRMVDSGEVKKFISDSGEGATYQLIDGEKGCDRHFHLKCTRCGAVIHMDCEFMDEFERHIMEHHRFRVDNGRTIIYGLCEKCADARSGAALRS